jgi:hypothetical protein
MEIDGLTRRQVADLGVAIGEAGYRADEFAVHDIETNFSGLSGVPGLIHHATGSWFAFGRHRVSRGYASPSVDLGHAVRFKPGAHGPGETRQPHDWDSVVVVFSEWLKLIHEESGALSFAEAVKLGTLRKIPSGREAGETSPFSPDEQRTIRDQLSRIELIVLRSLNNQEHLEQLVRSEFSAMREDLRSMKKGQWTKTVVGTLVKLGAEKAISTEMAQEAWRVIEEAVRNLPALLGSGS